MGLRVGVAVGNGWVGVGDGCLTSTTVVGEGAFVMVGNSATFLGVSSLIVKVSEQGGVKALVLDGVAVLNSRSLKAVERAKTPVAILETNKSIKIKFFLRNRINIITSLYFYRKLPLQL